MNSPDVPSTWRTVHLGDIVVPVEQVNPQCKPDKAFRYLDIASIDNATQRIVSPKDCVGKDAPSRARQRVMSGDILFSTVRTYLKNIARVTDDLDGQIASTGFCVIRPHSLLCKELLFYVVQTDAFLNPLNHIQRGTSYPAVRDSDVMEQPVPLPPEAEQHRIVAKIEELFTKLDAGVAALKTVQTQLKRYRQAVLRDAFTGKLTEAWREAHLRNPRSPLRTEPAAVLLANLKEEHRRARCNKYRDAPEPDCNSLAELPTGWSYTHIQPLLSTTRVGMKTGPFGSLLKKHEHRDDGIPVVGIENIDTMRFVYGSKIHISAAKAASLTTYDVQAGDVLISRSGTVGQVCVVPEGLGEARFSTNIMRISLAKRGIIPQLFCMVFNGSPSVLSQVQELCKGSTRDFLNQHILNALVFPLPPYAEQERILAEIERHFSIADAVEQAAEKSLKEAERLRQSILKRAFDGGLVPQNPKDEPAEKLLERIKTASEQGQRLGKRRKNSGKEGSER